MKKYTYLNLVILIITTLFYSSANARSFENLQSPSALAEANSGLPDKDTKFKDPSKDKVNDKEKDSKEKKCDTSKDKWCKLN